MTIEEEIQKAIKSEKAVIGYRETVKFLKSGGKAKELIIAGNVPQEMDTELKQNAKASETKTEVFDGTSKDLGTACGKPFPVSALAIKG